MGLRSQVTRLLYVESSRLELGRVFCTCLCTACLLLYSKYCRVEGTTVGLWCWNPDGREGGLWRSLFCARDDEEDPSNELLRISELPRRKPVHIIPFCPHIHTSRRVGSQQAPEDNRSFSPPHTPPSAQALRYICWLWGFCHNPECVDDAC